MATDKLRYTGPCDAVEVPGVVGETTRRRAAVDIDRGLVKDLLAGGDWERADDEEKAPAKPADGKDGG